MNSPRYATRTRLPAILGLLLLGRLVQAAPFTLVVNGQPTPLDPAPLVKDGDVYLSADVLSHALGMAAMPTQPAGMWVVAAYGKKVYVRPNTTRCLTDAGEVNTLHAPLTQGGALHVPVSTLAAHFPLEVKGPFADSLEITGPAARVEEIRQGAHPDFVRVVIDVTAPAPFYWVQDPQTLTVLVPGDADDPDTTLESQTFPDPLVPEILREPADGGGTNVIIGHRCPTEALVFTLVDPYRIVIDFPRKPPETPGPPKAPDQLEFEPSKAWSTHRITTARGVAIAYSVRLPVGKGQARLRPALADSTIHTRGSVSAICAAHQAYAGINGGYYAIGDGSPLGMLVIDGEWIKEPILGRTVLGVMRDGTVAMGNVRFASTIDLPGAGRLSISALNAGHAHTEEVVLYTRRWATATADKTDVGATRVMLGPDLKVLLVNTEGRAMAIPEGGYVLSVVGTRAATAAKATIGATAKLNLGTDPPWPGLLHAIGGGPRLVANGAKYITSATEHFRSDVAYGAAPRTAVGVTAGGDVLLVAVDGRQAGYSVGATLGELADFLIKLGAKDAMNLDGGGSTTLVVRGRVVNRPSDGGQRRVSNALLAFTN